jgi:hypothetical protein
MTLSGVTSIRAVPVGTANSGLKPCSARGYDVAITVKLKISSSSIVFLSTHEHLKKNPFLQWRGQALGLSVDTPLG